MIFPNCRLNGRLSIKGFTLVELSIVIVIIGLIVAGVVGGQALVKQAQIRAVITEYNQYDTAYNTFRLEYNALAGDMSNAWDYWDSNCAANAADCNGNGDGRTILTALNNEAYEYIRSWKHLSLAGIIPVNTTINLVADVTAGVEVPKSKYNGGSWYMNRYDWWTANADSAIESRHRFNLGAKRPNFMYHAPLFLPKESYGIDLKIDDGVPYLGKVVSHGGHDGTGINANCVSGSGATAVYNVSYDSAAACNMMFSASILGF